MHTGRLRPGRHELCGAAVWDELERRDITLAAIEFAGRAGRGGQITTIELSRADGGSTEIGRYGLRDELAYALEAPVWERYGPFAGLPAVRGWVVWKVRERRHVVISGTRGDRRFEETVS